MFTGIIEELGLIKSIKVKNKSKEFTIKADIVLEDLNIGDSIAVNGVCLTVINIINNEIVVDIINETLNRTTLSKIKTNTSVNLERAITLNTRIGGHLIQGHVETIGKITDKIAIGDSYEYKIEIDTKWLCYIIEKGSISIDGISLTIVKIIDNNFIVAIIPHTLEKTTFGLKKIGNLVNIETDIIAKYIENFLNFENPEKNKRETLIYKISNWEFGES